MAFPNNKETIKKDWTNITPVKDTHPDEHNLVGEVVEALQDKVGIDGDANTDSFDYKLSTVTGAEKAASDTDVTQVQTNLTNHENDTSNPHSVTKTQVGLSNVTNDEQVALTGNQTISGVKTFSNSPIVPDPTTNQQVASKKYVDDNTGVSNPFLIAIGRIGTPYSSNLSFTDEDVWTFGGSNAASTSFASETTNGIRNLYDTNTSTWTDADQKHNQVVLNGYLYVLLENTSASPDVYRVYRYDLTDITAPGTLMTFSGATTLSATNGTMTMACDGTNFYFSFNAGNSASYDIAKYTLSGTTFTYDSTINLSDSSSFNYNFAVNANGDIYTLDSTDQGTMKKYNSAGTLQKTGTFTYTVALINYKGDIYEYMSTQKIITKVLG